MFTFPLELLPTAKTVTSMMSFFSILIERQ